MSAAVAEHPFDLLTRLEARVRAAREGASGGARLWNGLAFRLGERWCVTPRADVRELINPPPLTRVPGARPWLLGLANVRGALLPVCDLRTLLAQPAAPDDDGRRARVLVLHSTRIAAGFRVDEVAGYRQFAVEDQDAAVPPALDETLRAVTLGGFAREGRRWPALSLHKVVAAAAFREAGL